MGRDVSRSDHCEAAREFFAAQGFKCDAIRGEALCSFWVEGKDAGEVCFFPLNRFDDAAVFHAGAKRVVFPGDCGDLDRGRCGDFGKRWGREKCEKRCGKKNEFVSGKKKS